MSPTLKPQALVWVSAIVVTLLLSCTKATDQYQTTPPKPPARDGKVNPANFKNKVITNEDAGRLLGEKKPLPQEEMDRRIRANTNAPILYGKGAGNVTFETTYKESQDFLGDPRGVAGEQHVYHEGMVVYWRQEKPLIPETIFVINGYLGKISFPAPWNQVGIDQSFSDAFSTGIEDPSKDPKAQNLLRALYNHLEQTNVDCLAENLCRLFLNEGGSYVVFELPNAYMLFGNNERRKLVQISLFKSKEPGLFRNPVDLLSGKVQVPNSKPSTNGVVRLIASDYSPLLEFGLGQTYEEVRKMSGLEVEIQVDSYAQYYTMTIGQGTEQLLVFEKTDFNSLVPLPTDRLMGIGMYAKHTQPLKFASKFIGIEPSLTGGINFKPLDMIDSSGELRRSDAQAQLAQPVASLGAKDPVSEYLGIVSEEGFVTTKASILAQNFELQRIFTENLFSYMESQASPILGSEYKFYPRITGRYDDRYSREVIGTLYILNPFKKDGRYIELLINETNGDLTFFTSLMLNPFEQKTYFAGMDGFTAGSDELMGIKLGDFIYLSDFGYSRVESSAYGDTPRQATVRYRDPKARNKVLISRGSYKNNVESSVLYETGNERNITNQHLEMIEVPGATLGINYLGDSKIGAKVWRKYEINVIETSSLFGSVRNICGLEDFDASIGVYDRNFQASLVKNQSLARKQNEELKKRLRQGLLDGKTTAELEASLTAQEKLIMKYKGCPAVSPTDPMATNLRRAYYFPNHQMKLIFDRRELVKVGIYKKPSAQASGGN